MPFGCLALRDGRNLDNIYDVTDKYEMGQVLKAKEFCELCLAKDRQTNKVFVCKKFLKKDGRKVRKAAKNEILILKMVNHPNILKLIDTFETRKEYFIIQELATGGDVFDWILDQGNYTERDASNVVRQLLQAVSYLHSLNIVHRNLKLENLMYYTENNHNKVVLRDFYLSKFENGSITEPCGTPEYLAPEVVARHRYGRPVDCWAVGVIMYILLSGNPPFYDETEEENTDLHNRIIFCRIVAGEFEFDAPYWDYISVPAKELVCRLMEVDQMLRITAADALFHEWIAGNGASEKNLKDGVCAQFEKNFAKAKWRKAIRVTTFMQRLRASEAAPPSRTNASSKPPGDEPKKPAVKKTIGNMAAALGQTKTTPEIKTPPTPIVTPDLTKPRDHVSVTDHDTAASSLPSNAEKKQPTSVTPETPTTQRCKMDAQLHNTGPGPAAAATTTTTTTTAAAAIAPPAGRRPAVQVPVEEKKQEMDDRSWCQTQLPEAVAERPAGGGGVGVGVVSTGVGTGIEMGGGRGGAGTFGAGSGSGIFGTGLGSAVRTGIGLRGDASPIGRDRRADRHSVEFSMSRGAPKPSEGGCSYTIGSLGSSPGLGRHTTTYGPEVELGGYGGSYYSSLYGSGGGGGMYGGLEHGGVGVRGHASSSADWQMDSVIEQIEKQMAAVLEKIEGDMPSLLEQINLLSPPSPTSPSPLPPTRLLPRPPTPLVSQSVSTRRETDRGEQSILANPHPRGQGRAYEEKTVLPDSFGD
ncbi:hypothetical protein J4Q44_G00219130 [Coregonus suidteri]|uniref:CaM kinase-like vesicle-associated protein n=1 Tax=Coregonus suidteri TaxID=861788 RepID=A0AAN8LBD3_9TELE